MWRLILIAGLLCTTSGCLSTLIYNKIKKKISENEPPASLSVEPSQAS